MFVSGCYSIEKTQEEWIGDGEETNYVGKLDSLKVRSGMHRVEIVGDTRYLRTAETCTVSYDDTTLTFNISDIISSDGKARMIIDNLEGGSYYFTVMTYDSEGNKSIPTKVFGTVYDEDNVLMETPRRITSMIPKPNGSIDLVWNSATSTYVEVTYVDGDGNVQTIKIYDDPESTNITSWLKGGTITVTTYIQKNEDDLDMLQLEPVEYTFPLTIQESIPRFNQGSKMEMGVMSDYSIMQGFTVELRARYTELAGGDQCVISCEGEPACGFMLRSSWSNIQFYVGAVNGGWQGISYGSLSIGEWYDFAVTYMAEDQIKLYVNGQLVASGNCGTMRESVNTLQAGTSPLYSGRYMRGDIQHISIWNTVRTAEQIQADYEQGYNFDGTEEGLEAYWPLTVNYGSPVEDKTGKHSATFTNVTWNPVN